MITDYLTVDSTSNEVEKRLEAIKNTYPSRASKVSLPHKTVQGRDYSALRIGPPEPLAFARGLLFIGGIHGNEYGGAEVCLSFAEDLLASYTAGSALTFTVAGNAPVVFSDVQVQRVVDGLEILIFPLVNPDGRVRAKESGADSLNGRKNGNGVDLARNFDFLWDHPKTGGSPITSDPNYRGPSANSEPETKNVIFLVDTFPRITRIVDIHTRTWGGPIVAYQWADDENQTIDPSMNFTTVGSSLGTKQDNFKEYIQPGDLWMLSRMADRMSESIKQVRNVNYRAIPGIDYAKGISIHGVSGVATDYFYSLHISQPGQRKIYGWMVEFGNVRDAAQLNPGPPELGEIIQEVNAGMMRLCVETARPISSLVERYLGSSLKNLIALLERLMSPPIPPIPPPPPPPPF